MIRKLRKIFKGRKSVRLFKDLSPEDMMVDELFKEWLKGKGNESAHFWDRWLMQNPSKGKNIAKMKSIINAIDYKEVGEIDTDDYVEIYENVYSQSPAQPRERHLDFRAAWFTKVAAIILFTLGSAYIFNEWLGEPISAENIGSGVKLAVKECPAGMKSTFRLRDGSLIKLNSSSKLTYPEEFSDTLREVWLEGEAYFQVKNESKRPFIVRSGEMDIKVLGTTFNVNNRANKNEVALVSGKLQVNNDQNDTLLVLPKEMVSLDDTGSLQKSGFNADELLAWEKGILIFNNDDFETIIKKLQMWYGVEFEVNDNFRFNGAYTGSFDNEHLENVLIGISKTSKFSFEIQKDNVILKK